MSDSIRLPQSVEELANQISNVQNKPPLGVDARTALASLSEEDALSVLEKISRCVIRSSFDGFVFTLIKDYANGVNGSPSKFFSPMQQQQQQQQPRSLSRNSTRLAMTSSSPEQQQPHPRGTSVTPTRLMTTSPVTGDVQNSGPMRVEGSNLRYEEESGEGFSPELVALGELEFRKAFLILSYLGGASLKNFLNVDEIRQLKDLPMAMFEERVWRSIGTYCSYINQQDRIRYSDWNSGKSLKYYCHVHPNGRYRFKGPYIAPTENFLQKSIGDDNILIVKFAEEKVDERNSCNNSRDYFAMYKNVLHEGIHVGLRRYRFFVFKDGGKEEKKKDPTTSAVKCCFVRMESNASIDSQDYVFKGKTVRQARSIFMHVDNVENLSKYMARFSLILSTTLSLKVDLNTVNIKRDDDIRCEDNDDDVREQHGKFFIHTDGTGFISEDLALRCPMNLYKGKCTSSENVKERKFSTMEIPDVCKGDPPLLIQSRLFYNGMAVKGTFLVNKKLSPSTIVVRRSMVKVDPDERSLHQTSKNSLEIVGTSNPPKRTNLSKYLIALLIYGGVPRDFFMKLLCDALEEAKGVFSNKRAALRVAINHGEMDDQNAARMIMSGFPLEESYLQYRLSMFTREEKKSLRGGKIPIPESFYLMGSTDPSGKLKENEVCVILENGPISGDVLVYRNPGMHFGDIHILKATYVESIKDYIGNSKYGILFPTTGKRSLADEMAGGDYDGDMFFVSRNPQLLETFQETRERWTPSSSTTNTVPIVAPAKLSDEELEESLFRMFLTARFSPSYTMGIAADSWLAMMDRLLTLGDDSETEKNAIVNNIRQLIDYYYNAIDAPKVSGSKIDLPTHLKAELFPHYMEKREELSYKSMSVLGLIYDTVKAFEENDINVSRGDVQKLPCFIERPASESCKQRWMELYQLYARDMTIALNHKETKTQAADEVIKKYKQILYGALNFEERERGAEDILEEALAIYHICYDRAIEEKNVEKCGFAWKVAGEALGRLFMLVNGLRSDTYSPSVLKELVC